MKNKCCIVIPTYKEYVKLKDFEKKTLSNTISLMSSYDIILLCPNSLKTNGYEECGICNFMRFDDYFFNGVKRYNELMLSPSFYEKFSKYEYMLITQLDSWIFEDKLDYFLNLGYDYIGGLHYINRGTNIYHPNADDKLINGNGGFSLRKIGSFIEASKNIKKDLNNKWDWEDVLYSYWYKDHMNIAPDAVSLKFGWQQDPEICFKNNNKELPFGCHKPFIFDNQNKIYQIK